MNSPNVSLEPLIDQIFDQLRQHGSTVADRRRAGLAPERIETILTGLGMDAPSGLLELYCACDGTSTYESDTIGEIQFFPGFYWMSLEDAATVYRAVSKSDEWDPSWLPFFANGGGDFYALVCDEKSPYFGEVVGFVIGEVSQIVEFESIFSLFQTIARSFDDGVFTFSEGRLRADYVAMRAIARQTQPEFVEHDA
jgi:cell wall assembly regulator SMI1